MENQRKGMGKKVLKDGNLLWAGNFLSLSVIIPGAGVGFRFNSQKSLLGIELSTRIGIFIYFCFSNICCYYLFCGVAGTRVD